MRRTYWLLVALLPWTGIVHADNWPAWRGPHGDAHSDEKSVPLSWSATENMRWKIDLPQPGNSSPIVWGERIFLTQELDPKGHRRALLCLDRKDGKTLWQREIAYAEVEPTHETNPYCSATPATDGQRVVASFGSAGLFCFDFAGKELWHYEVGKLWHIWGNASSPIFHDNLVILWCGPGERQFLVALDKETGRKVWQHDEPGGEFGKNASAWAGTWATPLLARVGDHEELIQPMPEKIKAFDPKDGKELWSCAGLSKLVYASPVCSADGIVVVFCGYGGPAVAVRAGGRGDVTSTHRLWLSKAKNPQRIGSPVLRGDYCYLISAPGRAQCFELKSGKDLWAAEDLGGQTWSTPVLVGDKLLLPDMKGTVHVLEAAPTYRLLGRNSVDKEMTRASLAVADGELFLRTYRHLWCIGRKK
jgi:outer membrane protein assembly factor BamB